MGKLFVVSLTILVLLVSEIKLPFFVYSNSWRSRFVNNFILGFSNSLITIAFLSIANQYILTRLPSINTPLINITPNIAGIISFLLLDLYMYLWHRLMHLWPIGWRFHRVHHSDRSMNVSTAYRFHIVEVIASQIPKLLLIYLSGIKAEYLLIYETTFTIIVALHHSNINLPSTIDRYLALIIVTPNYHRLHHSQIVEETNSNYGSVLTWWDYLGRSQQSKKDYQEINLGLINIDGDLSLKNLLFLPWKNF